VTFSTWLSGWLCELRDPPRPSGGEKQNGGDIGDESLAKLGKKKAPIPGSAEEKRSIKRRKTQPKRPGFAVNFDPKAQLATAARHEDCPPALAGGAAAEVLDRLWEIIDSRKSADPDLSHSARLLSRGRSRVAQKLGEEAVECLIELMAGNRPGIIGESADLLYHLLVIWVQAGIQPREVWQELHQRETVSHLTEGTNMPLKRLLGSVQIGTSKIP
jgi:phosphoribosyl-ATP pyrophosphohydrolase